MRMRLIGILAALMMLAPAAGFARTSVTVAQPTQEQTAPTPKAKKKAKKAKKSAKKAKKNVKKEKKGAS